MATRKKGAKRPATHRAPADEHAAAELVLYIENTSDLSPDGPRGQGRDVLLNALRKWRKGTYDPALAVRLFEYLAESGAKRYAKEFGSSEKEWSTMFTPATRQEAARQLEASFRNSAEHGEYDHIDTRPGAVSRGIQGPTLHEHQMNARRKESRLDRLRATLPQGYTIETYSPGDGVTRYRFFQNAPPNQSYFGPDNGIYTALGYAQAETFAQGLMSEAPRRGAREVPRMRARDDDWRKYSMTYGELPPFEKFEQDIRRPSPDNSDGSAYWPEGTLYPMELVSAHEIELAETFGLEEFRAERQITGRNTRVRGFKDNERAIYEFLEFLVDRFNNGDEEAGDLASSIMYTLGYEWI